MTRPGRRDGVSADDFAAYERLTSLSLEDETEHESLVFEHADVRGAKAEHVVLTDVQLQSVDAQGAALPRLAVRDALFADCDLSNARLIGASLVWVDLRGCRATGLDVVEWAREGERRGAGEILLTSMDRDGTKDGYDIALTAEVSAAVRLPVIASGGAGTAGHMYTALTEGGAEAALAASIFHFGEIRIGDVKKDLAARGLEIRL